MSTDRLPLAELRPLMFAVVAAELDGRQGDAAVLLEDVPSGDLRLLVGGLAGAFAAELVRRSGGTEQTRALLQEEIARDRLAEGGPS